jgi:hypothetical protein
MIGIYAIPLSRCLLAFSPWRGIRRVMLGLYAITIQLYILVIIRKSRDNMVRITFSTRGMAFKVE